MARPRISILLPIQDDREAGVDSVRSWLGGQTAAGELYELIALAPGRDPRLEGAVRPLLRPQDRWLEIDGASSSELFNAGAKDAQGEFIFLTESHCVPERECLEVMLEELDRTGAAGVRGHDPPEARGWLGELERDKFLEEISREEGPDHWRRVLVHSLALHRQTYLDAGGLPPRYGDFGAWVLAIELDRRGDRVAFSPRPRVRHVYDGDLRHVRAHLSPLGGGRSAFGTMPPSGLPPTIWGSPPSGRTGWRTPGAVPGGRFDRQSPCGTRVPCGRRYAISPSPSWVHEPPSWPLGSVLAGRRSQRGCRAIRQSAPIDSTTSGA